MTMPAWLLQNAAIATLAALLLALAVRVWRVPAKVEHLLWLAIAVKFILPPVATLPSPVDLPIVRGLVLWAGAEGSPAPEAIAPPAPGPARGAVSGAGAVAPAVEAPQPPSAPHPARLPWLPALLVMWATGGVWYFGRSLLRHRRWRHALDETPAPVPLLECMRQVAGEIGVRPTAVRLGSLSGPVMVGPVRPTLIWPRAMLGRLTGDQERTVITHELMHVRRGDLWIDVLDLAIRSVWWWYPVAAFVSRRIRDAAERACDSAVVRLLPDQRHAYATALLDVVEAGNAPPAHALGLHGPGPLQRRLRHIMEGEARHSGRRFTGWLLCLGTLAMLPAWTGTSDPAIPAQTSVQGGAGPRMSGTMSRGNIAFNDSPLPELGRDSWFIAFSETDGASRRLEMVRDADGGLRERYLVNGALSDFTADDRRWLEGVLEESGYDRRGVHVEQSASSARVPAGPHVHVTTDQGVFALWATAPHPLERDGTVGPSVDAGHPVVLVYQARESDPVEFARLSGAGIATAYSVGGGEAAVDDAARARIRAALEQVARTIYAR